MEREGSEAKIRGFALKLRLVFLARRTFLFAAIWLFFAGTTTLILRISTNLSLYLLAALMLWAFIPIVLAAWLVDLKRVPLLSSVRALFDSFNDCGGLLMATIETSIDPLWLKSLPGLKSPQVAWRWFSLLFLFLSAVIFAMFAILCPIPDLGLKPPLPLEIRTAVEDLNNRLKQLEDQAVIESNKVVEIKEELARLEKESTGQDPAKAWETLDSIKDSVAEIAKEALEKDMALSGNISEALSLSDIALDLQQSNTSQEMYEDVMRELGDMIKGQAMEALLAGKLPQDLLEAVADGRLTPEQLRMLTKMLKTCNANCQSKVLNLANMKWLEGNFKLVKGNGAGCDTNALLALLASGNCSSTSMENGLPGRGGVGRGRGDAPMTWQDDTSETGVSFKEQALPPSLALDLKNASRVGVSRAAPTTIAQKEAVASSALMATGEASGDSRSQTILPRHRGVVRRFFERNDKTE